MARVITDGTAYVNLSQVDTSPTQTLGIKVQADSGEYVYGQANGAIAEGEACSFEVTSSDCQVAKQATGTTGISVGIACEALADNQYGWFWVGGAGGYENGFVATGVADNAALTFNASAGLLSTGGTAITGLYAAAANSSGSSALTAVRSTATLRA